MKAIKINASSGFMEEVEVDIANPNYMKEHLGEEWTQGFSGIKGNWVNTSKADNQIKALSPDGCYRSDDGGYIPVYGTVIIIGFACTDHTTDFETVKSLFTFR